MSVEFHDYETPTNTITLFSNNIKKQKKSSNKITPVKKHDPVIVRLGKTTSIKMTGRLYSNDEYNNFDFTDGETVLVVDSSDYLQFPVNSKWLVVTSETTQSAGPAQWDYSLELAAYGSSSVV